MRKTCSLLASIALLCAHSGIVGAETVYGVPVPSVADYQRVREGVEAAREGRCGDAMAILPAAIHSTSFAGFPEFVRRRALENAVECTSRMEDRTRGIPYIQMLIPIAGDKSPYWLEQLLWAAILSDQPELGVKAIRRLAELGTSQLSRVSVHTLYFLYAELLRQDRGGDLRYEFLSTIYKRHYTPPKPFEPADELMLDYAIMLADRGNTADLKTIILSLNDPIMILRVRIDRRFDSVRQDGSLEEFLDLQNAAERNIERLRALTQKNPEYAVGFYYFARALAQAQHYDEALKVIEPVALKIRIPWIRDAYVDIDDARNWVLEEYADALGRETYVEQSGAMTVESIQAPEMNSDNVSQQINTAHDLYYFGQYEAALALANDLDGRNMSPYGRMFFHTLRVCAISLGKLSQDYGQDLTYLVEHERDNAGALREALLCKNDMDGAADHLIRQLQSQDLRNKALLDLQFMTDDHDDEVETGTSSTPKQLGPEDIIWYRQYELRSRPDVRRAIDRVGRIEEIPLDTSAL
jgi:tetratricopeptide (TPR) repeat protein